jgi:hypothetical protein
VKSRNFVLALVGASIALAGVAAPAASADEDSVTRRSATCDSPSNKKINVSWGSGSQTTTVYFNNHCNQRRALKFQFHGFGGTVINKCFVAPARTQSSKELDQANPYAMGISTDTHC